MVHQMGLAIRVGTESLATVDDSAGERQEVKHYGTSDGFGRSEERRVGKEWRSRWSRSH